MTIRSLVSFWLFQRYHRETYYYRDHYNTKLKHVLLLLIQLGPVV